MMYETPLVWFGVWRTPEGRVLSGFHVWGRDGCWKGAYKTCTRARAEANQLQ